MSGGHHVGLEQRALQVHVVVGQRLVHGGQHLLRHVLAALQVVVAVGQDLGLHDGDDAVLPTRDRSSYGPVLVQILSSSNPVLVQL